MTVDKAFPERLTETMKQTGIAPTELARKIGCSRWAVFQWKKGTNFPTAFYLAKLCRALNVSADYLLGLTDYNRQLSVFWRA